MLEAFRKVEDFDGSGCAIGVGDFRRGSFEMWSSYNPEFQKLYHSAGWISQDPVVTNCAGRERDFHWGAQAGCGNTVMNAAADYGMICGSTCSSIISGNSCIVSLADTRPLSDTARVELHKSIKGMHMSHLAGRALGLNKMQRETMIMFAHGYMAKQVAHNFEVSEDAIKLRKAKILRDIGIQSFNAAIHICAIAGVTHH